MSRLYVYTSNVDAHAYKVCVHHIHIQSNRPVDTNTTRLSSYQVGFNKDQIYEFHGSCEEWQCSDTNCKADIWRLPDDFVFTVDPNTMRAPPMYVFIEDL